MNESVKLFEKDKYACIKELVNKDSCKQLTKVLQESVNKKETTFDEQCPLSESIYGHPIFDRFLEEILPTIENHSGKRLYPTYSYARLYKPEEELLIHRDRPSCEISVTLTLGFEGTPWPIYIGNSSKKEEVSEVIMDVGDAIIYRGMDLYHWREKFKGEWQAQVFLHYVDADGPHAEWKYDKRERLGIQKNNKETDMLPNYAIAYGHLSDKFCDMIVEEYKQDVHKKEPPYIGGGQEIVNTDIRNVDRLLLNVTKGVSASLASLAMVTNNQYWKYAIDEPLQSEFLMYKVGGKYTAHVDTFHKHSRETRKLTVIAFLNDEYEGGKFYLNADGSLIYPPQQKGNAIIFPSYMIHGVEPVTKGIRYSVVTWLIGPYFK